MKDIYFDENYGKLYEKCEHGKALIFKCETENGIIINQFIKREVPTKKGSETTYYDITTPYGYGGPYIEKCINKEKLLNDYEREFSKYCLDNNIVAEFVRFHPFFNNNKDFESIYHPVYDRHTLGTNLEAYNNPVQSEFSKSCRQNIRKKLALGINYKIITAPTDLSSFKKCYYSTMDRNNADNYYYFDDTYFDKILKYYKNNTILVEATLDTETIAAGLYFICNNIIHIHLSGTLKEFLKLSPAYILRYGITVWGKENGFKMIHHGGGRSSAEDDNLYMFKKQFAKNTKFDFYLGKKIWNPEAYNKICEQCNVNPNETSFFPAYRK